MEKAYLILADGTVFAGTAAGARGSVIGETVFTTGMTGYAETLTDPSYFGQIITQTFPLIGNYGVIPADFESSRVWARGYVVRELCDNPANFRSAGALDDFLTSQKIIAIAGIDTRALTKKLRADGVMNGMIASGDGSAEIIRLLDNPAEKERLLADIRAYRVQDAVQSVQDSAPAPAPSDDRARKRVVLFDFGAKENIRRELERRGLAVITVPCNTTAETVQKIAPDGIMLSNGPGDPADNAAIIAEIRKLCDFGKIPMFGICLGHQMLALARGAKTAKLKYGHRGGNHPVKDTATGRVYITSQNHGYAVEGGSFPGCATLRFVNANDGTCEGIDYTDIPAFSVQFHPEACGGPHDTNFLFDRFLEMIQCH